MASFFREFRARFESFDQAPRLHCDELVASKFIIYCYFAGAATVCKNITRSSRLFNQNSACTFYPPLSHSQVSFKPESRSTKVTLVLFLILTGKQPSICLEKKIIVKSSTITRLGSYPERNGKIRISQFKCYVALVLCNN